MKTLDRTKDYSTVMGDDQGRVFEQDGVFFRSDGTEHGVKAEEVEQAAETSGDQVDSQLDQAAEVEAPKAKKPAKGKK